MGPHKGNLPIGETIPLLFDTFGGNGQSITMTGLALADIKVYKDGGTTQRSSTAGFTLLDTDGIDFDAITGIHGISIDTGDDTDSGFFAAGSYYDVVIDSITVGSQTVSFHLGSFRLVHAESEVGVPKVDVDAVGGATGAASRLGEYWSSLERFTSGTTWSTTTASHADLDQPDDAHWNGQLMIVTDGTYKSQARIITDFDAATNTITFYPPLTGTPGTSDDWLIVPQSMIDVWGWYGSVVATPTVAGVPEVDVTHADGVASKLSLGIILGEAQAGTLSTTQTTTNLTGYTDNQLIGRLIIWTSGDCEGEAATITDYASASGLLTFSALTTAPSASDTFKIV